MSRGAIGALVLAVALPLTATAVPAEAAPKPRPTIKFRVATINTLGSSHTSGPRSPYASGPARTKSLVRILDSRNIQVAGLQEFQPDQRVAFDRHAAGWARWPKGTKWSNGTMAVVWRTKNWSFVKGTLAEVPFYGEERTAPTVLLRHKKKGVKVWFSSFHNPSDTAGFANQKRHRVAATKVQASVARKHARSRTAHVITGDMNEQGSYFCRMTKMVRMTSPQAPRAWRGRSCRANGPAARTIDWILGSPGMTWFNYTTDNSRLVRRTTDHPVRYTSVVVDTKRFPGSRG